MFVDRPCSAAVRGLAVVLLAAACSGDGDETGPAFTITPTQASVSVGGSVQLSALNSSGTVVWSSSDETVASVVSTGFVTGKKPGQVTITASGGRGTATAAITVLRPPAIGLSASALSFNVVSGGADVTQNVQITDAGDDRVGVFSVAGISYTAGQPSGWLTATLAATAAPTQLAVRVVPAALQPGTYSATISVAGSNATNTPQTITVTATVAVPPTLVLSSGAVNFNATSGGANPPAQTVNVTNGGSGTITGLAATVTYAGGQPNGWLAASLSATSAPAVLTLTPTLGSLANGTYTATVSVAGTGAANSPRTIAVTMVVGPGPSIALSSSSIGFQSDVGGANPAAQPVTITNAGGGSLTGLAATVTYGAGATGWLTTVSLDGSTAPATLTLRPTVGTLASGTYTATVAVASPVASNSPRTVTVTLTVGPPPALVLGTTGVSVSANRNAASATVQVAVTRQGGGVITGLTVSTSYGSGNGWLTATLAGTSTPTTLNIQAAAGSLAPGTYTATVSVATPNASNSPQTISVTFTVLWSLTNDVYPAIAPYCTACHFAGGSPPNLSTATNFRGMIGQPTTVRTGYPLATTYPTRIVAGNAGASYVVHQVARAAGAYPMPPSGTAVPANVINLLVAWINQGAPQN
jgi:hypothetical protein